MYRASLLSKLAVKSSAAALKIIAICKAVRTTRFFIRSLLGVQNPFVQVHLSAAVMAADGASFQERAIDHPAAMGTAAGQHPANEAPQYQHAG